MLKRTFLVLLTFIFFTPLTFSQTKQEQLQSLVDQHMWMKGTGEMELTHELGIKVAAKGQVCEAFYHVGQPRSSMS